MTRGSVLEYVEALQRRYLASGRKEKSRILDEVVEVTGYHRKAATRLLLNKPKSPPKPRGRPACYGAVAQPLRAIWEASDRLCSRRLQPFMPEMVRVLRQHGEQHIDADVAARLCKMSPATIDRLLRPWRRMGGRRPPGTTRPGSLLKSSIPIRTFADWQENRSGFLEIDLVAHCGESASGFYLNTLSAVDVASGWIECLPVWGKGQTRVRSAVHRVRQRLPFGLLGIDSDNGSEFINHCFRDYCSQEKITLTRSRSYKKNDSCHVEQKNGNVVRRLVGYDRYTSRAAFECLDRLYNNVRLYVNFFQPTMKLLSKTRHGARVHKVYETAQTPYQRLLNADVLIEAKRTQMAGTYQGLNPVLLLKQINLNLEQLWRLADHVTSYTRQTIEASATR
jgi:hypothetical protein